MLVSVQYLRAVAALLVVLAHLSGFAAFGAIDLDKLGSTGVDIFFVISGYIMWRTSADQRPSEFVKKRVSRIIPAYWFYTSLLILLALAAPSLTPRIQLGLREIVFSYLFIPYTNHNGEMNPILLQGWTLNYEMYFYLIFAASLTIIRREWRLFAISAFFVLSSVLSMFVDRSTAVVSQVTSAMLLEFVLGMMVCELLRIWKTSEGVSAVWVLVGTAWLLISSFYAQTGFRVLDYGMPAAFLLAGMVGLETRIAARPSRLLLASGDSSYSLYLSHPFVLNAVHKVIAGPAMALGYSGSLVLALVFGGIAIVAASIVAHFSFLYIEKPGGKFLSNLMQSDRRSVPLTKPGS